MREAETAEAAPPEGAEARSPSKLAAKFALHVHERAQLALSEPERTGRLSAIRAMMSETDMITGVEPGPGVPELGPIGSSAFHHALAAFYRRHGRLDPTIESCIAGVAVDPQNIALRRLWLETLNSFGRLGEAGPLIQMPKGLVNAPVVREAIELLARAEKLFLRAGETELALDAIEQRAFIGPTTPEGIRALIRRAEKIEGGGARIARYREQIRAGWSTSLPSRLADGLEALKHNLLPVQLPEPALTWAWSLADRSRWTREEWRRAVDWGERASGLLLKWWYVHPDRRQEIADLVDAPDLEPIRAGRAAGRAQIIVSAHSSASLGAFTLFETSDLPFKTLGGTALVEMSGDQSAHIGSKQRTAIGRELVQEVRRASVLAITADVPTETDRIEIEFMGRTVVIKSLPATLAQRYGCDTWWCESLWQGDRIVVGLQRLPDPWPDETSADFAQRWGRAYMKSMKAVMRGDPRNHSLTTGIWRYAGARVS